jgi:hypothetical protein
LSIQEGIARRTIDPGEQCVSPGKNWWNPMSYNRRRSHFEKARLDTADKGAIEMLDGLKHLSLAIEEDLRSLEQGVRNIRDIQSSKQIPGSFTGVSERFKASKDYWSEVRVLRHHHIFILPLCPQGFDFRAVSPDNPKPPIRF